MPDNTQPVIVIGMHRSGTTMISGILRELGCFMGWDLHHTHEARFFMGRNERILNACKGSWDHPEAIDRLLENGTLRDALKSRLFHDLRSPGVLNFLGPRKYFQYRSLFHIDIPWGWKDPRNTFLLPIWLELFPGAKVVHIFRNGVDVAKSLVTREENRVGNLFRKKAFFRRQADLIREKGFLLYLSRRMREVYKRLDSLSKYEAFKLSSISSLEEAFELWCRYMERALRYHEDKQIQLLSIKYEDFLANPRENMKQLVHFCGLEHNGGLIERISSSIDRKRRYAFLEDESLVQFYDNVKNHCHMVKLGYSNVRLETVT